MPVYLDHWNEPALRSAMALQQIHTYRAVVWVASLTSIW